MAKKSSNDSMSKDSQMKIVVLIALVAAVAVGYMIARAKYKPQIRELSNMVSEKDKTVQKLKTNSNKLIMKDGAMWVMENGDVKEMTAEIVLSNGDKATMDGKVVKSDGTNSQLQNGDSVTMDGEIVVKPTEATEESGMMKAY